MIVVRSVDFTDRFTEFSRRRLPNLIEVQQPVIDLLSEKIIIRCQDHPIITGSIVRDCVVISVGSELRSHTGNDVLFFVPKCGHVSLFDHLIAENPHQR